MSTSRQRPSLEALQVSDLDGWHAHRNGVRKSRKNASWNNSERKRAELGETPAFSFEQPKILDQAVTAYMSDARFGQKLSDDALRKKRNVLRPLTQLCANKGKLHLKQITLEDLVRFARLGKMKR